MKVSAVSIRNFRRLEDVQFSLEDDHTVFVGPNNTGKTSAASAFRLFFKRGEFTLNDFTVACIAEFDKFGKESSVEEKLVPAIEMDLWLSIDPQTEFGRVFALLPNVTTTFDKVGIRLRFCVKDAKQLRSEYSSTFPEVEGVSPHTLSHFLSIPGVLSRHFSIRYFALEKEQGSDAINAMGIEPEEGKRTLHSLIRIDFIDAQRNIHDQEGNRQNKLSTAFASFYKHNLEKPAENEEANKVISENNSRLTDHYKAHFEPLLKTISKLGVPSAHDRSLRLVSALSAEQALQGSTELYYVDSALKHELPEAYNGLGFKNLVYIAIQISHFHSQWLTTEKDRELCQVIFVEEPEVHLHAQVQQVFITNMWKILYETAKDAGEEGITPQLAISTHSSHIVDTVEFNRIRYFCRCLMKSQAGTTVSALVATKVLNLREFSPTQKGPRGLTKKEQAGLTPEQQKETLAIRLAEFEQKTLNFLKKYLKLTHCDLFFADAAVLVEGTVEKLLLPQMIDQCAPNLKIRYITVLELGGAYAHTFSSLLTFLGIPYLVITDIDTVDAKDNRKSCPADQKGAATSNATLKELLGKSTRDELVKLTFDDRILQEGSCFVTFQRPVTATLNENSYELHGRTLEETFVYENLQLFKEGSLDFDVDLSKLTTPVEIRDSVYTTIRDESFKKTQFALGIAASSSAWQTPFYIREGLTWLEKHLMPQTSGDTEVGRGTEVGK